MNKKSFMKRIVTVALSIIMVLGLMPMTAFAASHTTYPVITNTPGQYDLNGRPLLAYVTPGGGQIVRIKGGDDDSEQHYQAIPPTGWKFFCWTTYYEGSTTSGANPKHFWDDDYRFSTPNDSEVKCDTTSSTIRVNKEWDDGGTFYLYAHFVPAITFNYDKGIEYFYSYRESGGIADSIEDEQSKELYVLYETTLGIDYICRYGYIVEKIDANNVDYFYDEDGQLVVGPVTRCATVTFKTRLMQQKVIFDANGGSGAMTAQTFSYGETQKLTENSFTKTGYTFTGWNTKADGSGKDYTDKASMFFIPEKDGESMTLYAQWKACTYHLWENGECTACGTVCFPHTGGRATCTEKATCSVCRMQYGELGKHLFGYQASQNRVVEICFADCGHVATADIVRDENVSTVYTGSAIEALKVDYSDNWLGGDFLDIVYSDNVNVGIAKGSISYGASQTFEITEAAMTNVSAQGYSGIYDGQGHSIAVNAPAGATVAYKTGDGVYSATNPTFKDAGTYTVSYKVSMANYADVEGTAEVRIDKAPLTVTANDHSIRYGEAPANNGVTCSGLVPNETEAELNGALDFDYTYAKGNNIGTYDITPKGLTSNNYKITFAKGALEVERADATGTAPTANDLTYTGAMQELVTAGTVDGGKMVFSLDKEGSYSETVSAKDAGEYTVWYKVIGDDNHNSTAPASITVEIKKAMAESDNPQTDGNSHMALWIALLFISGGTAITLAVVDRQRK